MTMLIDGTAAALVDGDDEDTIELQLTAEQLQSLLRAAAAAVEQLKHNKMSASRDAWPSAQEIPEANSPPPTPDSWLSAQKMPEANSSPPTPDSLPSAQEKSVADGPPPSQDPSPVVRAPRESNTRDAQPVRPLRTVRVAAFVGLAVVTGMLGSTAYFAKTGEQPAPVAREIVSEAPLAEAPPPAQSLPAEAPPAEVPPAPADPAPVRFVNPFDRSEVFEFPPGTSDAEARDAVADLLLQRARDRLDAGAGPKCANCVPVAALRRRSTTR